MRPLLFLAPALLASACSSVLGFDDFTETGGTDAGTDTGPQTAHVRGTLLDVKGSGVPSAGVDFANREGVQIAGQLTTDGAGAFDLVVPLTNGQFDGYLHFSSGGYLDSYQHLPGPQTSDVQVEAVLLTTADIQKFADDGETAAQSNTGTMIVQFEGGAGIILALDGGPTQGDIRYFSDSGGVASPAELAATASNGLAIALNLQDGVYVPDRAGGSLTRSYVVEPDTVVSVVVP